MIKRDTRLRILVGFFINRSTEHRAEMIIWPDPDDDQHSPQEPVPDSIRWIIVCNYFPRLDLLEELGWKLQLQPHRFLGIRGSRSSIEATERAMQFMTALGFEFLGTQQPDIWPTTLSGA